MIINIGDTITANHGRSGEIINIGIFCSTDGNCSTAST